MAQSCFLCKSYKLSAPEPFQEFHLTAKVFNAAEGEILGPYEWEGMHELILVEELKRAELNDDLKEVIKERIFEEWAVSFLRDGIRVD